MQIIYIFLKFCLFFFQKKVRWGGVPFFLLFIYTNCIVQYFVFRPGCYYSVHHVLFWPVLHRTQLQETMHSYMSGQLLQLLSKVLLAHCDGYVLMGGTNEGMGNGCWKWGASRGVGCDERFCILELYFTKVFQKTAFKMGTCRLK